MTEVMVSSYLRSWVKVVARKQHESTTETGLSDRGMGVVASS